ncbi:transient receptor potential ion channel family protein [Cyberlindnera jadinii NRRL Y-1542]|uniref:TRP-domain-containing protein n=1 Tax=Cyberlindnera jadinii (strain ATCC 18201 / CBS 1600 / BCRC 20928 / JCM 3617 / NBRC 0987 / NRRL Y-1542) TaxID=983966 RepID=A0A1E4S163_CYBJN|nr:TRP-domain-containing protein [Cyberlindnera jadinii NRRL Y-1542]ODV73240.1 TRP-domain-containing protein [Cyberlindnera jadinii NRRL Y-1542]
MKLLLLLLLSALTVTCRVLKASSLVTCMENSQLSASYFSVEFNPDDKSLHYTLDFTTEVSDYIIADVDVYAYGFKIITKRIDTCSLTWKQFCPLYPGSVEVDSIEYIDDEYADQIPGIAYTVPDIDAFARVLVSKRDTGEQIACIQAFFTNGKTVSQTGVKWATAVIAGIGLLTSAIASVYGNSNAASHLSANAVSLFLYFQSVVVISMMAVDAVPPIAASWSENLAWSMGIIRVSFMQKIFRWYIQSTGGDPDLNLTSSTINILVQRSWEYAQNLVKRAQPVVLYGNANVLIFRGIKRVAYQAGIENSSLVVTGFTFFILCGYVLVGLLFVLKYGSEVCIRAGWMKSTRFLDLRQNWKRVMKGSLARYILIGFTQTILLSLWEFTQNDSAAVIVLAVLFFIMAVGSLSWAMLRVRFFAKQSIQKFKNPAAVLYGDQKVLDKYGFIYTMFTAEKYYWSAVLLFHAFFKCMFIGLAQSSGKTQAMAFWLVDMLYLGLLIHFRPFLNTPTNIVAITIQLVTTINSFLFVFFSNLFGQPAAVASIMGWVFFIMNAAFSLILLLFILVVSAFVFFSKNPDARFKPARDDRTSFQRYSQHVGAKGPAAELLALGIAAKDHNDNWQSEIYEMNEHNDRSTSSNNGSTDDNEDKTVPIAAEEKETFAGKLMRKLSKGKGSRRDNQRLVNRESYISKENDDEHYSFDGFGNEEGLGQKDSSVSIDYSPNINGSDEQFTKTNDILSSADVYGGDSSRLRHSKTFGIDNESVDNNSSIYDNSKF